MTEVAVTDTETLVQIVAREAECPPDMLSWLWELAAKNATEVDVLLDAPAQVRYHLGREATRHDMQYALMAFRTVQTVRAAIVMSSDQTGAQTIHSDAVRSLWPTMWNNYAGDVLRV